MWTVELHGLEAELDRMVEAAQEQAATSIERGVADVLARAQADWPVLSGRSRAGLGLDVSGGDDRPAVAIRGRADYTDEIVQRAHGMRRPWVDLVVTPMRDLVEDLEGSLAADIEEAL